MACSMAEVMAALGDRWGALIMRDLLLGLTRYDDLRRSTGVTNATLSGRLKDLEEAGLIVRRLYQRRPERHDYVPTEKGRDIALVMQAMVQVGDKWRQKDEQGAPLQFVDGSSGHQVRLALIDAEASTSASKPSIKITAGPGADDLMKWRLSRSQSERASRGENASD
jgi:DNA-binding HxlR family transcriptional regulator